MPERSEEIVGGGTDRAPDTGSPRRRALPFTAGLVLLGLVLAIGADLLSHHASEERERAGFERATIRAADSFEAQVERVDMVLNAVHGLHTGQVVTAATYRTFVTQLTGGSTLAERYPGVAAVGFAHERDGVIAFQMVEPAGVSLSFADVRRHPELTSGLWQGAETGSTSMIELAPGLPGRFVIAAPLHRTGPGGRSDDAARLGWSLIFIDEEVMLREALRGTYLVATIQDADGTDAATVTDPATRATRPAFGMTETIRSSFGGHTWEVEFRPLVGTTTLWDRYQHLALGIGVLAIVWLAAWGFHVQASGRRRAEVEVRRATRTIRAREQQFRALAGASPTGIFLASPEGAVRFANPRLAEILDVDVDELHGGVDLWERMGVSPADAGALLAELAADQDRAVRLEPDNLRPRRVIALRAAAVLGGADTPAGYTGTVEDITEQVDAHEALAEREAHNRVLADRFAHQARHDPLTGAPNRLHLLECLEQLAHRPAGSVALLLLDLDGFKIVNDTLGHAAGDELLIRISERLAACARDDDVFARLGGDEFAFLLRSGEQPRSGLALADRLLAAIQRPVSIHGETVTVGASIGVAVTTPRTRAPDELLQQADLAMYAAKAAGRGRVELFQPEMGTATHQRHTIERELRSAIENEGLDVAYQPVVDLVSERIVVVEALVRWDHPALGTVPPSDFVPVAEHTGLIDDLGAFVRRRVLADAVGWWQDHEVAVAVNVSGRELARAEFVDVVRAEVASSPLPPEALILELTESQLATSSSAIDDVAALREAGIRIAIDDFGAGYSSLSRLRQLPVDILKVDRTFISGVEDPGGASFVRAIARLGMTLGCDLIAEGIETEAQAVAASQAGCRLGQGYYFHRPMPAPHVDDLLAAQPRTRRARGTAYDAPVRADAGVARGR